MSYTVEFWSFAKKDNSTKQPTGTGTSYTCDIADGSGMLSPSIKLHTSFTDPSSYSYARISEFSRYYFVAHWRYDRGLWWADLVEDVLATYKSEIGALSMYVLRSASEMDGRIVDTVYPVKAGTALDTEQNNSNPFAVSVGSGYFVVGIINNDASAIGVVSYYVFTNSEFRTFASFLLGNSSFLNSPPEISDSLLKCLVNPTQYIVSCIWIPNVPSLGAAVTSINVGWWTISGISAHRLTTYTRIGGTVTISVPKHPEALTRGYYLLQEPYSRYYLDFPPFGAITLNANDLVDETLLDLDWNYDAITGQGRLDIKSGPTGHRGTISVVCAQVGVPVALAQNAPDLSSAIQQTIDSVGSAATAYAPAETRPTNVFAGLYKLYWGAGTAIGNAIGSSVNDAGAAISNIANAMISSKLPLQVVGGNGGFMSGYYPIRLILTYATLADDNTSEWGRPLCRTKTLSTLSGYIQCADSDFEISCTETERSTIAGLLTAGFFYE